MITPGDQIAELISNARSNVLIVAPFMRSQALSRLLECIPEGPNTILVTRWRLADLLAGASDLDVFDIAEARGVELALRHDLHAKLFAADQSCLIGSANITSTALGWRNPANLELLVQVSRYSEPIIEFERSLLSGAVKATAEQRDKIRKLIENIGIHTETDAITTVSEDGTISGLLPPGWTPTTMNPEELYLVYSGAENNISRTSLPAMREELAALGIVPGLDEPDFRAWVELSITQTSLVTRVLKEIQSHGEVTEHSFGGILESLGVEFGSHPPREVMQALERWLTYFLPVQYEIARDSIKLIQARPL